MTHFHKHKIYTLFVLAACLFFCGCDAIYRALDKEGAEEKELVGEIVPFEINLKVEEVQSLLSLYGYSPGEVDGVMGLRTRNAIEKFQIDHGMEPSRFADKATWEKLCVFKNNGLIVDFQLNIEQIQLLLQKAGYKLGNIDGKLGPKTEKAILEFQKGHNLKVDGKIGYKTLTALAKYLPNDSQNE